MGENGSVAYDGKEFVVSGIVEADVVDTLGAGDSYIAGFLNKALEGEPLKGVWRQERRRQLSQSAILEPGRTQITIKKRERKRDMLKLNKEEVHFLVTAEMKKEVADFFGSSRCQDSTCTGIYKRKSG